MEVAQMQMIESTKKNSTKKEKKSKKEKTEKKDEKINSNDKNIVKENTINEPKIKFNEKEISNIIKQHLYDKSQRSNIIPPLKIKKSQIKSKNRISFTNLNNKLQFDKINKKLIRIINIERLKTDPIMIYFDKWFDKTYQLKNNKNLNNEKDKNDDEMKKKNKKQKKQKDGDLIKETDTLKFKDIPINESNHVFDEFSITQDDVENKDENKSLKKKT